ncbi:SDR family NAD(P)-dependent oxidoreductase [Propioniferax innocua]|uniref:Short subunit dehydrogenase n=1 Tax=Propioniferax innocua TaxID=1753 RepID=A0A542ZDI1_9ACTN|nr:SDR family NAD(P)-dependent oxidoreductase [Propioniferax innocua]TQL58404.1 short subunit dehydrogenase [Propioniferax innocua]
MVDQRVAIVTGAERGIGAEVSRRFAADGMAVAVLDLKQEACEAVADEISAAGGRAIAVGADVSEPDQVETAVSAFVEKRPPVFE